MPDSADSPDSADPADPLESPPTAPLDRPTSPHVLLHLTTRAAWATAQAADSYVADSLSTAGFIHLSAPHQVTLPANALYRGRTDLVLLVLDPARLTAPVRWETGVPPPPTDVGDFPHLYGPLNLDAVRAVRDYRPGPDGTFGPPPLS